MKEIQINGPYFSNYSYARVNRGLALALSELQNEYIVSLSCDPERIDYMPSQSELDNRPEIKSLVKNASASPSVVIYNNFPKTLTSEHGLAELAGDIKIMYIAWEESIYPKEWVAEINENVHGVMAATSFVREILRSSGVKVPISVVPNAMEEQMKLPPQQHYPLPTSKSFKFLHISTAKKRKGVDLLLKAYFSEFTKNDDVVLIIKSFPGPDNVVENLLNELKTEDSPEVVHINNPDLTEEELTSLILQSDCGVYPSRAEGFGLPILESMYHSRPVIATNYSGYLDFCDEECAWMIDYKLEYANDSEFANIGAKWAEPDLKNLQNLMREIFETKQGKLNNSLELSRKVALAKQRAENLTWKHSAAKTLEFVKQIEAIHKLKTQSAGVISFVNDETGISDYTLDLYKKVENSFKNFYYFGNSDVADRIQSDEENVLRLWNTGEYEFKELQDLLQKNHLDFIHIQYHSGTMFSANGLDNLIKLLDDLNIQIYITLHAVKGESFDFIRECRNLSIAKKIFIHNKKDFNYAKETLQNVELFIHPILLTHKFDKNKIKETLSLSEYFPIIATHGLLNKNKGIPNLIEAIATLKTKYPKVLFLSLSAVSSNNIFAQGILDGLQKQVKDSNLEQNICLVTEFLEDEVINLLLQASDINIFAYSDAGESASGAVRKGINSLNPTIVTDITQFSEFEDEVIKIPNNDPKFISTAIDNLLQNDEEVAKMRSKAKEFIEVNNYEVKSLELLKAYSL